MRLAVTRRPNDVINDMTSYNNGEVYDAIPPLATWAIHLFGWPCKVKVTVTFLSSFLLLLSLFSFVNGVPFSG